MVFCIIIANYLTSKFIMHQKIALIVDDEQDTCFLLKGILEQQQLMAACVHSLADAKLWLQTQEPDLVFLDNHLKDGHGIEFIPYLLEKFPQVKVIIITAFDTEHDKQAAYAKGAHHFMGKPFNRSSISETLAFIFPA